LGDTLDEFDENFFLNFSDATNATITKTSGVGTILDNDEAPTLTINYIGKQIVVLKYLSPKIEIIPNQKMFATDSAFKMKS